MNALKPIIIIDDDVDDIDLLVEAYDTLNHHNELLVFRDSSEAYEYLVTNNVIPFLVISDIVMPKMSGMELSEKLQANPNFAVHFIPFVFSTGAPGLARDKKSNMPLGHGHFEKKADFNEMRTILDSIINYWSHTLNK